MYLTRECCEVIDFVLRAQITAVSELAGTRLRIVTSMPFGAGNHTEMLVEANFEFLGVEITGEIKQVYFQGTSGSIEGWS